MMKNWKTTIVGVATIIGGIGLYFQGNTEGAVTAILGGIGLLLAKDHDTTGIGTHATKEE